MGVIPARPPQRHRETAGGTEQLLLDEGWPVDDPDLPSTTVPIPRRRRRGRWVWRGVLVTVLGFLALVGWSLGTALAAPGSDPVSARVAEWGRDHGLGGMVTWLEQQQYRRHQPAIGGTPANGIPVAAGAVPVPRTGPGASGPGRPAPAPVPLLASGQPLPGEGQWQTVVLVHGHPAVRVASLRPDQLHTSYLAGVMWLDPTYVRGRLHPGYHDPGGIWQAPTSLTPDLRRTVVAAFNSGFRLNGDSEGGYYSEGRTAVPLVDNAASLVLRTDGTATVGSWNHEVRMSPLVASVRQNLTMLVDSGTVNPDCLTGGTATWGKTIGQAAYIDRSGFGVTATGAEVYAAGPALSVCSLGRILRAAGVVRGMEMDINPTWVTGAYFHDSPDGSPKGFRLYPAEPTDPQHYFLPSSRDWYGWYARP